MFEPLQQFLAAPWKAALEIIVLAVALYYGYRYVRPSRGGRLLIGMGIFLLAALTLAHLLELGVLGTLLKLLIMVMIFALLIVFQQELRRLVFDVGTHRLFSRSSQKHEMVSELIESVRQLSSKRFGALFAIERTMDLNPHLETGVGIDGEFSHELVLTIFHPKTTLHDGGMILRKDRIQAAGCVFPVTQRELQDRSMGLRHRAAIGMTEETDAVTIVVSEETGDISICLDGKIEQDLEFEEFKKRLLEILFPTTDEDPRSGNEQPAVEDRVTDRGDPDLVSYQGTRTRSAGAQAE